MKILDVKKIFKSFKVAGKKWWTRDPFRESAIIAYYAIFSLPPLLVIIISLTGLAFGREAVNGEVAAQVEGVLGKESAKQVQQIIASTGPATDSIIASILSIITLLFGATGVFAQMQTSLNLIWGVEPKPDTGFLKMLKDRLFSFGLILSIGFLLLISLVVSSAISVMGEWIQARFPDYLLVLVHIINFALSIGIITLLFAMMFKILPDAKVRWKDVWVGALTTAVLFTLGKYGLALYFGKAEPASTYGAAGSIVLILLWVSYSCMIVFLGAEFTRCYMEESGRQIEPVSTAKKINA